MLSYLKFLVNTNVDKSKMLTISKGLWSGCVKFKRFSAIIYCMAKPSKMETIGKGLDSLDQVARKIPAVELNSKDLKRVEIQGSEPLVNNDFENAQEEIENITGEIKSKLNVVHPERKPNVVETKKEEEQSESHSRNYAKENVITHFARDIADGNYPTGENGKAFLRENETAIFKEVELIRKGRIINQQLDKDRVRIRQKSNSFLKAPTPKKEEVQTQKPEVAKKEVTIEEKPKPERQKDEIKPKTQNINELPVIDKPVALNSSQQELGRRKFKNVEDFKKQEALEITAESVADKLVEVRELTQAEVDFHGKHPEITRMVLEKIKAKGVFNRNPESTQEESKDLIKSIVRKRITGEKLTKEEKTFSDLPGNYDEIDRLVLIGINHQSEFNNASLKKEKSEIEEVRTSLGKETTLTPTPIPTMESGVKPEVEKPAEEKEKPFVPTEAERNGDINGLLEFNLGKLNINKTELVKNVPEFFNMSVNQQLYTLQKLEQKLDRDLDRNSVTELQIKDAENKKWGSVGKFLRGMTKGSRLSILRNEMSNNMKSVGLEAYKDNLKDLTDFVSTRGLDVDFNEKGRMILEFISRKEENPEHQKLIDDFNTKASKLSDVPYDWTTEHAVPILKKQASMIQASFEKSRKALLKYESKNKKEGVEDGKKLLEFTNIDSEIQMSQFLNHNTGIAGKINQFVKNNKYLERGGLAVLGASARGLASYGIAFGGGIIASSALGGLNGWIRKSSELRKLEEDQRRGIDINKDKKEDDKKKIGVKKAINISDQTKKINNLVEHIKKASGDSRQKSLETLQTRINIVQDRIQNLGAVNFGQEELTTQAEFIRSIKGANALLIESSGVADEAVTAVYKEYDRRYLQDQEESAERKSEIRKAIRKGMLIGGGAFVGGFLVRDIISNHGEGIQEAWKQIERIGKSVYSGAVGVENHVTNLAREGIHKLEHLNDVNTTESIRTINPAPETIPTPAPIPDIPLIEHPLMATADSRGVIGMFDNLQKEIHQAYDGKDVPEQLKYLTDKNPEELAKMFGGYRPGQTDGLDSFVLNKGASLTLDHNNLVFHDGVGGTQTISAEHGFDGKFFDSTHSTDVVSPDHNVIKTEASSGGSSAETFSMENVDDQGAPVSNIEDPAKYFRDHTGYNQADEVDTNTHQSVAENVSYKPVGVEGVTVNSPEISGRINVSYDTFGRVTKMDLGTTGSIAEVRKFLATPDKFLNDGAIDSTITRSTAVHELSGIKQTCAEYLKMRNFLKTGEFKTGTPEYKYLTEQMNSLGDKIHKNVGNIFKPLEDDKPLFGNIAAANKVVNLENHIGADEYLKNIEITRTTNHVIDPESKLLTSPNNGAVLKYGEAKIDGNVVFFKNGYVGFYDESIDQATAGKQSMLSAAQNMKLTNGLNMVDQVASQMKDGTYRVLTVYKAAK